MAAAAFDPPRRILMGPGPSDVPARVLEALARPTIGHLDPEYLRLMDAIGELLRRAFRTENRLTLAVSGTGSAAMESCIVNLVEPDDEVIVCIHGVFGGRLQAMAERCGATVHRVEAEWGQTIDPDQVAKALATHPSSKLVAIVHAETSTGAHQPLEEISRLTHDAGALLVVDAVTSLAGAELEVDAWAIDACYSGTQKCLSCPPGLAPVTFSPAAVEAIEKRRRPVASWYLDMSLISSYWGEDRAYHHTAPINMSYALHEALRLVFEEGLEARIARHRRHHRALRAGLEALGLSYIPQRSLPMLNAVAVPAGVDEAVLRRQLLDDYGVEIGGGLGPFAGRAWRIGLMGAACTRRNVVLCLAALGAVLAQAGAAPAGADALARAAAEYE